MQLERGVNLGREGAARLEPVYTNRVAASSQRDIESASEEVLGPTTHADVPVARVVGYLNDPNPSRAVDRASYHPGGTAGLCAATAGVPCRHSSREIRREPRR